MYFYLTVQDGANHVAVSILSVGVGSIFWIVAGVGSDGPTANTACLCISFIYGLRSRIYVSV